MKLMSPYTRKKVWFVVVFLLVSVAMYLVIKNVLPIIWPFLLAFCIAVALNKFVMFFNKKLHFNKSFSYILVVFGMISILLFAFLSVFLILLDEIRGLIEKMDVYLVQLDSGLRTICNRVEETLGVDTEKFYDTIRVQAGSIVSGVSDSFMSDFLSNTKVLAAGAMNFIILLVLLFTAIIYMTKDMDKIQSYLSRCYFAREILFAKRMIKRVFGAYLKTQLILIGIISAICVLGLFLLKHPYSLGLGILIGCLDALPLFGVGTVLLPWTLYQIAMGNYFYGAMLFSMFVLSYVVREYLEPKIMGNNIGIHPIVSLIAIYVGYNLFGFLGLFIGPFVFVFIYEIMKKFMEN